VHLRLVAYNAAAVMPFRFAGCGIGQVDVVVDFPAAGVGRDHPAFDFAQTRDDKLSPSQKKCHASEIRQLLSRNSLDEHGREFCICTLIAPFKSLSH
jgi:hypothetical protein